MPGESQYVHLTQSRLVHLQTSTCSNLRLFIISAFDSRFRSRKKGRERNNLIGTKNHEVRDRDLRM